MTDWRATPALSATALGVALPLALAVALRRPDLVALAAPGLVVLVRGMRHPGDAGAAPRVDVPDAPVWEGDRATVDVATSAQPGVDLVQIAVPHDRGVALDGPGALLCLEPGETIKVPARAVRWGRARVGPVTVTRYAAGGLFTATDTMDGPAGSLTVLPERLGVDAAAAPPRAAGLVGLHQSRRPGTGSDLYAVREYAPGDRLRRIRWPVSLRAGQLYVTATDDERNADVVLVVDTRIDVDAARPGAPSSLDLTVRAAAAVSEHYLGQGDSVGLIDLGTTRRAVRLAGGRRQRLAILAGLLDAGAPRTAVSGAVRDRRLEQIRGSALVIVFSALVDEQISARIAALAGGGRAVVVIDTLPAASRPTFSTEIRRLAWRIALLRRRALIDRLRGLGVPVVAWSEATGLGAVLASVSRGARAARVRR